MPRAIVYYAGHGVEIGARQAWYLLMKESHANR
jgi:hypothetical protein